MTNATTVDPAAERELRVTRTFDAPVSVVYAAWATADTFSRWWVPASCGLVLLSCEMDVRTGGGYRLTFSHEGSPPIAFFGRYLDVVPGERIAWSNDESADGAQTTVTFEGRGNTTHVVLHETYRTAALRDEALAGAATAMPEQFEQLDRLLGSGARGARDQ